MCQDLCWVIVDPRRAGCCSSWENGSLCVCRQGEVVAHDCAGGAGTVMGETVAVLERVTVVSGMGACSHSASNGGRGTVSGEL